MAMWPGWLWWCDGRPPPTRTHNPQPGESSVEIICDQVRPASRNSNFKKSKENLMISSNIWLANRHRRGGEISCNTLFLVADWQRAPKRKLRGLEVVLLCAIAPLLLFHNNGTEAKFSGRAGLSSMMMIRKFFNFSFRSRRRIEWNLLTSAMRHRSKTTTWRHRERWKEGRKKLFVYPPREWSARVPAKLFDIRLLFLRSSAFFFFLHSILCCRRRKKGEGRGEFIALEQAGKKKSSTL